MTFFLTEHALNNMAQQVVILIKLRNPAGFRTYVEGHMPILLKHGGKVTAAMPPGVGDVMEGTKNYDVVVTQEWPSIEAWDAFYADPDYQQWKDLRHASADCNVFRFPKS